jgi:hypothetical protein
MQTTRVHFEDYSANNFVLTLPVKISINVYDNNYKHKYMILPELSLLFRSVPLLSAVTPVLETTVNLDGSLVSLSSLFLVSSLKVERNFSTFFSGVLKQKYKN